MSANVDRRTFLASLGGLAAAAALPSFADNPAVFPARGRFERLALAYNHVHIGLKKPFSVLHISDTHLTDAYPNEGEKKQKLKEIRTRTFGGRQEEALRDSLEWAKKNVDYVIHTGDMIDWQSEKNFDLVRKYFGGAMFGSMGNHEYSQSMWLDKETPTEANKAATAERIQKAYPFAIHFASQVVNDVNFVSMDSVYGYVTPTQVELFNEEVKKGLPIVLCQHVPFYTDAIWRANDKFWKSDRKFAGGPLPDFRGDCRKQHDDPVTRDFIAALKKQPLLKAILAGHLHITVQDRFSPTAMEYVVGGNFMFHGEEVFFT